MNPQETDIKHNRNVTDGEPLSDAEDDDLDDELDEEDDDLGDEDAGEE